MSHVSVTLRLAIVLGFIIGAIVVLSPSANAATNVSTCADLIAINTDSDTLDGDYILQQDLDCSADTTSVMIGDLFNPFTGTFNGGGHSIVALLDFAGAPNESDQGKGLFGYVNNATIENLSTSGYVKAPAAYVGGIVGFATSGSNIRHVHSSAVIEGDNYVGGVAGRINFNTTIIDSSASGNVKVAANYGGGLAGYATNSSTINRSFATGNVTYFSPGQSSFAWGGLAGGVSDSAVTDSYARGNVNVADNNGGLIGYASGSILTNNFSTGVVSNSGSSNGFSDGDGSDDFNNFFDQDTSTLSTSVYGQAKQSFELTIESTFTDAGWDFVNTWDIDGTANAGYPFLQTNDGTPPTTTTTTTTTTTLPPGGSGNPIQITNCTELQAIPNNSLYYEIANNFSCVGVFTPIAQFGGHLEGNEHTIDGITINSIATQYTGIFRFMAPGSDLANLTFSNVDITSNASTTGGVVGYLRGTILNVHIDGEVTGASTVGGISGLSASQCICNSSSNVTVTGTDYVGGLVGNTGSLGGAIMNSFATGDVNGNQNVGGVVGYLPPSTPVTINGAYATGDVTCTGICGGFVGFNGASLITNSWASGNVVSTGDYVGGFVGQTIMGGFYTYSFARGNVTGPSIIGSFGGQMGYNNSTNIYGTGLVTATGDTPVVGGLFAQRYHVNGSAQNSFYDAQYTGIGQTGDSDVSGATGKTTGEMKSQPTYTLAGWDFSTRWVIDGAKNNGYPILILNPNNENTPTTTTTTTTSSTTTSTSSSTTSTSTLPGSSSTNPTTTTVAPPANSSSLELSSDNSEAGTTITVTAKGLQRGTQATIWLESTSVLLKTLTVGTSGSFTTQVTIPSNADLGNHHIVVRGTNAFGASLTLSEPFVIGQLPATGNNSYSNIALAISMMLLGAIAFLIARNKASKIQHS